MNATNALQKPKFSVAMTTPKYQQLINNTLRDPNRARRFTAAITSAVAVNPALQECDAGTILAGALLGESLNLSPSPQLGQYYLVPFECKQKGPDGKTLYQRDANGQIMKDKNGRWLAVSEKKAQFVLGYKGYIQLAIRSGQYIKLNVMEIKQGELVRFDPLNEEIVCNIIDEYEKREAEPTIGYYAMFQYANGFRKAIYWSKDKMLDHADKFSPAFSKEAAKRLESGQVPQGEMWKYSSFWYKNFDDMAKKTMLRQLISRWGIMSIEMQSAFEADNGTAAVAGDGRIESEPIVPDEPEQPLHTERPMPVLEQTQEPPHIDITQSAPQEAVEQVDLSKI